MSVRITNSVLYRKFPEELARVSMNSKAERIGADEKLEFRCLFLVRAEKSQ